MRNFVAAESGQYLAAGALHVPKHHPVIEMAIEEFRTTYWRQNWGYNGPELLTRVMKVWCRTDDVPSMKRDTCGDLDVLSPTSFYPVHWKAWQPLFADSADAEWTPPHDTVAVHMWNQFTSGVAVLKNSSQLYSRLAKDNCPRVFFSAEDIF